MIKRLIKSILTLIFIIVVSCVVIVFLIPKSYLIQKASSYLEERYPIHLEIKDVALHLWPYPNIELKDLTLERYPDSLTSPLPPFKAESLSFGIPWISWLDRPFALEFIFSGSLPSYQNLPLNLRGTFEYNRETGEFSFPRMRLELAGLKTNLVGKMKLPFNNSASNNDDGFFDLEVNELSFSLPTYLNIQNENGKLSFHYHESLSSGDEDPTLIIENGSLKLGSQLFSFSGKKSAYESIFLINADPLRIDDLKNKIPLLESIISMEGASLAATFQTNPIPLLSGTLTADLVKAVAPVRHFSTHFLCEKTGFSFSQLAGKIFDGELSGSLENSFSNPEYQFNLNLKNIDLSQIASAAGLLSGRGDLTLQGKTSDLSSQGWNKNLSVQGKIHSEQASLKDLRLFDNLKTLSSWNILDTLPIGLSHESLNNLNLFDETTGLLELPFSYAEGKLKVLESEFRYSGNIFKLAGEIAQDHSQTMASLKGTLSLNKTFFSSLISESRVVEILASKSGELVLPLSLTGILSSPMIRFDESFFKNRLSTLLENFSLLPTTLPTTQPTTLPTQSPTTQPRNINNIDDLLNNAF